MVELLSPAGNKENFITAIKFGANAVYLGLKDFSARKPCENFDFDELKYCLAYAKTFNVKVYVTVNTLIKDEELEDFINSVIKAYNLGVDAFILQDMFLSKVILKYLPDAELHLSTQGGVCNVYGANLAKEYGFKRVILARETKLEDICNISKIIETEVFIQGALCSSFSGHCYFSSIIGGNSGNRGNCKQPCRKLYRLNDNNFTQNGYLISLSDLCLNKKLEILKNAGVKSFKIEGRLRSKEYVAFATGYYRSVLDGKERLDLLKGLTSTFNRGDYTEGLAFGQKDGFLSTDIQSNKGLKVGVVGKIVGDTLYFKDYYNYDEGDSFKIIRNNKEVGNAIAVIKDGKLKIQFKGNVKVLDDINITKDISLNKKIDEVKDKKKDILVSVEIKENEQIVASCNGVAVKSETIVLKAINKPTNTDEIIKNFNKTDIYPYNVKLDISYSEDCFIPKSVLNNVRASLYNKLFYKHLKNSDIIAKYEDFSIFENTEKNSKNNNIKAVIVSNKIELSDSYTDVIYMPLDYNNLQDLNFNNKRVWLYLQPYLTTNELEKLVKILPKFYGIYAQGYYALDFSNKHNLKVFCGTGFNVFNTITYNILSSVKNVEYITLSKELSYAEINKFSKDAIIFNEGAIEVMDFIYCPFTKRCSMCNKKNVYTLIDDNNRKFALLRYNASECRFKLYNNSILISKNFENTIQNLVTLTDNDIKILTSDIEVSQKKNLIQNYTQGNFIKGTL